MLIPIGKFAKEIGVTVNTVRKMQLDGELIPFKISKGGHRYYSSEQLNEYLNKDIIKEEKTILYARVSSKNQKDDLDRQIENLKQYAYSKGYQFEIITDIGSGVNYTKQGLKELIKLINEKQIDKIIILYKDRLVRFGFEIIEYLCELNNVKLEIIDNTTTSKEQELTDDLIQIITVFANRLYGSKSKKTQRILSEIKNDNR